MKCFFFLISLVITFISSPSHAENVFITVASTTSTEDSGFFSSILPQFTAKTGIEVRVIAKGTGQAIQLAKAGDVDVLFVHDRLSEEAFVKEGYGVRRWPVMRTDFIIVGPKQDPAKILGLTNPEIAFTKIAQQKLDFLSRGDESGTHKAERRIWVKANYDPTPQSGTWYRESGAGMGQTLNMAAATMAYTLSDRASFSAFRNKKDLTILVSSKDPLLDNPYGLILVNPARYSSVKFKEGQIFIDWLTSKEGQTAISNFRINGEQVFFPTMLESQ